MSLFSADYDTPLTWQHVEQATPGRVRLVSHGDMPGSGKAKPAANGMRVDVLPGELYVDTDGYTASRSEVYGRAAAPMTTPPELWPDPVGAVRWYTWSLLVPQGFQVATDARWIVCTQWKGLRGGGPPVGVEVKRSGLRLGGTRTNVGLVPNDGNLGPIRFGVWTRLDVGVRLSPDPTVGWVTVLRDGNVVVPQLPLATMDLIGGAPDPIYLKQGIYRDALWDCPHTLFFGPITVSDTRS